VAAAAYAPVPMRGIVVSGPLPLSRPTVACLPDATSSGHTPTCAPDSRLILQARPQREKTSSAETCRGRSTVTQGDRARLGICLVGGGSCEEGAVVRLRHEYHIRRTGHVPSRLAPPAQGVAHRQQQRLPGVVALTY
jgi:hypothetical protein